MTTRGDRFARLRARSGTPRARREALALLEALERTAEPTDEDIEILVDGAFVWVGAGLAREARAVVERWRKTRGGGPALARAEAIYTIAIAPAAASGRLRALAGDPLAAAATVANHVFRGELRAAIDRCRAERWFVDHPKAVVGVSYGTWALAMLDDFDGALGVIRAWRSCSEGFGPVQEQALLAAEARVESIRHHHVQERALLEEAIAVCEEWKLGIERAYLEASHAIALARSGELAGARRIVRRWPASSAAEQVLDIYRDVARTELALLAGDFTAADRTARRVLEYADRTGNAIYGALARFHRVLAATRATLGARLDDYGRIAAQLQIPLHLRRHRLLSSGAAPRDRRLVVRTRLRKRLEPLLRVFFPTLTDLASDVCWHRVQRVLYLRGDGPFSLAEHPVLCRVLEAVVMSPAFAIPLDALFASVWEMRYDPLRHEGKCHVALHRLRALIADWSPGADRVLEVRDGLVRIRDDASVCVIDLASIEPVGDEPLAERIAGIIESRGDASPAELARHIGGSRSAMLLALRALVADGRLRRVGRGRAVRYAVA